jgi:hypothetical protein
VEATVEIRHQRITVASAVTGKADVILKADSEACLGVVSR